MQDAARIRTRLVPSPVENHSRSYRAVLWLLIAVLVWLAWLLFGSHAAPLLGDYAEWTFQGVLLRDVLQGHPDAGYVLKNYPVPNSLTTVALGLLMLVLPWKIAAKLWLVAEVALGICAVVQLQRCAGKRQGWPLLVLPAAMLLGTNFWFGFSNFNLGVYFAMLLCGLLLRDVRSRWLYGALLLAAFFSHMIPFAFALLALGMYARERAAWRLLLQAVPSGCLSLWYFVGRALHGDADSHAGMAASVAYMRPAFAAFKVNSYLKCWGFINPASNGHDSILLRLVGAPVFTLLFAAAAVVGGVLLWQMARAAWRAFQLGTDDRFLWRSIVIFFVAGLLMPGAAAGISDPGARMVQVAVWSGVCIVGISLQWLRVTLIACGLLLLATDCYLLRAVALQPPLTGADGGPLPARLRQFAHVYYDYSADDYRELEAGRMDVDIYPTAMFLREKSAR